jgi:hypothetical protein
MWTCPQCGEMHDDNFKECWKCASPEHSPHITAEPPKLVPPPEPKLRTNGSIVMRVVVAFIIGVIAGLAIFHRSGLAFETALMYGLYMGGGLALFIGVFFWILFPYEPTINMPEEQELNEQLRNSR